MGSAATPCRVLIVDDNEEAAELMQMLLGLEGFETAVAFNARDGLASMASFRPDVVCSDIGMPEMNGIEFCRVLRTGEAGQKLLMIAITGWSDIDTVEAVFDAGFDHHMAKPVVFSDVSHHIHRFIGTH